MSDDSELLETVRKICGLLELLAEDKIAQRDAKQRTALLEIVGASATKQKSVFLMDGSPNAGGNTQGDLRESKIPQHHGGQASQGRAACW